MVAPGCSMALLPVYVMGFYLPFLWVEKAFYKAVFSVAYVVTSCVWRGAFSSVLCKVVCCQKLGYAGGCEDGADLGKLTCVALGTQTLFKVSCSSCLRLVLCGRQPVLWFERGLRFGYWLMGVVTVLAVIFSSRVGGSAHLVWCFKTPLILWLYFHDSLLSRDTDLYQENS